MAGRGPRVPRRRARILRPQGAVLSTFTVESAAALGGPDWLRAERQTAAEAFARAEMPTDALEEWRYSRIGDFDLDRYRLADATDGQYRSDPEDLLDALGGVALVVHTYDGRAAGTPTARGVEVSDLAAGGAAPRLSPASDPDPYSTLNRAFAPSWLTVRAAPGTRAGTVVLVHHVSDGPIAVFPRLAVEAGRGSELSVVEMIVGGSGGFVAPVTVLDVGDAAHLSYTQLQLLDRSVWQVASQSSFVGRDASLVSAAVALGGDYARLRTASSLVAPGANGKLLALYFGSGSQMHDFRTVQHHVAPKTQSELVYKGVVANESHSVYSGLIRVDKGAGGTNAMQTNRNLVLNEGAHADSVPNLEIEDNDVRCSHASAVGPIADDQRFYLESRGVPTRVAERLIALGFMDDLLEQLPVKALAPSLRSMLAAKLGAVEDAPVEVGAGG